MSFLKWLFEDSKPTVTEQPQSSLQQELAQIRDDFEAKQYNEAYEWFLSVKDGIIRTCILECKEAASKGESSMQFNCVSYKNGHEFTGLIVNELKNLGLKAKWICKGNIEVRW